MKVFFTFVLVAIAATTCSAKSGWSTSDDVRLQVSKYPEVSKFPTTTWPVEPVEVRSAL